MSSSFGPDVVSAPQTEETPKTAAEFILTVLKLQIPICNLENLEIASGNPLGTGVTAEVRQGSWKGAAVAVKTLKLQLPDLGDSPDEVEQIREKHDAMLEEITREVRFLSYARLQQHPNIVPLLAIAWNVEEELEGKHVLQPIAIVELQDCTLRHFIENEPDLEIEAKIKLITDILNGIAILHDQGLVHSDMKPENILINKSGQRPSAKIGDFGYSVQTYYGSRSFGTTIDWASPESHSAASPIVVGENAAMQLGIDPHAPILSLHNNIDYTKVEEFQARDMFSLGLVAFFILKGELPFGKSETTRSHDDWLALKLEAQQIMDSWMKRKFRTPRIHPIPHEHYDSDSSLDSTLDPTRVWEMRLDSPNVTQWMVIPERVPMLGLTSIPRTLLSVDPKERLTASQLREVFRIHEETNITDWSIVSPLVNQQAYVSVEDIPAAMWKPLWSMLLKDAQKENAHTSLMDFIAVCYLDGDLVDRDESEGLRWLLQAATEGISDRFRLIQARERVLIEYTRAGKELNLPLAERTDWILDSIFLLRGGYWHTLGYPEYASKLQGARDSFKRALAYLSYENIPNILDIGLNIYVLRNPTDADERRQREANAARMGLAAPSTFAVRKVVLSANNTQANSLVAGGIDVTEFWDVDLVRAVAHYGYEDSIRLLHRLDVTRQHVLLGSNTESPQSALVRAINNRQVSFDGLSRESSEFGPAIHEAVLNHRFSCLSEILRQSWTTEHEEDRVQLNNSYVVEDIYGLETPLDVSIRMLQPYLVCLLLAHGADCNNVNEVTGETALHICCRMDVRTDDSMVHWCDRLSYLSAVTEERKSEDMVATHRVVFELLLDRGEFTSLLSYP